MKTENSRFLFICIFSFFLISSAQAQFIKKLQKRVEQKVENAVIEKAADKAADKATESVDKAFDSNPFGGGTEKADASLVADAYDFTWKYSLKMTTKDGEIVFDYYLKPEATYFGFTSATMERMFTVMDNANNVTVMFMETKDNNIGMVTQLPSDLDLDKANDETASFNFETLPNKTINGYNCKGVKATNEDYEMIMYFTNETAVSFDDIYKNKTTKIPVELKDYFDPNDNVLMMSMDMKNLKNKKLDAKMECIGLEEVQKLISKSEYKFM